jgi:hypothetical protein
MKSQNEISELRVMGFYQLKKLLGLGDERLKMILAVGEVEPILFTNVTTLKTDELYPFFAVKCALSDLQGKDVQLMYETKFSPSSSGSDVQAKLNDVNLRLMKKRKRTG